MAKFRCLVSGNIVEFTQQVDIDSMEGHQGYEWVDESVEDGVENEGNPQVTTKKRGRPSKNQKDN